MNIAQILHHYNYYITQNSSSFLVLENDATKKVLLFKNLSGDFSLIDLSSFITFSDSKEVLKLLSGYQFLDDEIVSIISNESVFKQCDELKNTSDDVVIGIYLKITSTAAEFRNEFVYLSNHHPHFKFCLMLNQTFEDNNAAKSFILFNENYYRYLSDNVLCFKSFINDFSEQELQQVNITSNPYLFSYSCDNNIPGVLFHYKSNFLFCFSVLEQLLKKNNSTPLTYKINLLTNLKDYYFGVHFLIGYLNYHLQHYFSVDFVSDKLVFSYWVNLSEIAKHEKTLLLFSKFSSSLNLELKNKHNIELTPETKFVSRSLKNEVNSIKQIVFPYKMEYCQLFMELLIHHFSLSNILVTSDIDVNETSDDKYGMF